MDERNEGIKDFVKRRCCMTREVNHTNHLLWAIFKNDYLDFDYYLANLEAKGSPHGGELVPDFTFFLLDDKRNIFSGTVNIGRRADQTGHSHTTRGWRRRRRLLDERVLAWHGIWTKN